MPNFKLWETGNYIIVDWRLSFRGMLAWRWREAGFHRQRVTQDCCGCKDIQPQFPGVPPYFLSDLSEPCSEVWTGAAIDCLCGSFRASFYNEFWSQKVAIEKLKAESCVLAAHVPAAWDSTIIGISLSLSLFFPFFFCLHLPPPPLPVKETELSLSASVVVSKGGLRTPTALIVSV